MPNGIIVFFIKNKLMWRDYLYFTKNDKRGLIVLLLLMIIAMATYIGGRLIPTTESKPMPDSLMAHYTNFSKALSKIDSIADSRRERQNIQFTGNRSAYKSPSETTFTAFNPNRDDSSHITSAGIPPFIARNIIRYRQAGGIFKKKEDLRRIYGMTNELYAKIKEHIIIEENTEEPDLQKEETAADTKKTTKYASGTVVDLNKADTTELMKIPGIGQGYSKMIVAYRTKLGGYVSVSQLCEIEQLPDSLQKWFKIDDTPDIRRININTASIERLMSHPYINFYMAKAIIEYRKKYKRIESIRQLEMLEEFDKATMERLSPYIQF